MALFKKKPNKVLKSEFSKLEEERAPNHWTFNDDPLLNMEPVFSDQIASSQEEDKQFVSKEQLKINKLSDLREKLKQNMPKDIKGPLGSIISGAIKKSQDIQNEVLENDPVIAKLHKIEELRKTGAIDESVYTDVNKIKEKGVSYSARAKKYHEENSTVVLETELERVKRLSEISKNRINGRGAEDYINRNKYSFGQVSKKSNKLLDLQREMVNKLEQVKLKKTKYIDDEFNLTLESISTMHFDDEATKEEFLIDKINEYDKLLKEKEKGILLKPKKKSRVTKK
ncbi:hypothetical protein SCORR_v1c01450 [Spiroplasma corruscae]|uniref:Uncharacterized protein n=1 Tax=Spiroplasma corruscae TaxID=216934 RepID=A0A222EN35_9MOLU|nr:hypothetical protein [Spiroplasma corruscae]ASP27920.1 hypothetical protein SCORR_v1c01450 [Spiroplasma corruscae]